jgi:IclR family acetate operon transcriptional repressor
MQTGTQSIDRAAQLLVLVVESEESSSVGALAEAAGLPKSTVSRVVAALERQGLVQRDRARGAVRPGPVLLRLARRGLYEADVVELCRNTIDRLGRETGETVIVAVPLAGGREQYVAQVTSRHFLGATNWVGRRLPHHCTAVGKVFLAFGAAKLSGGRLERLTPATITDRAELAAALEDVRARGYAIAVGELEPGLAAVAAPVLGADGRAVAAVSVSGHDLRLPPERLEAIGALVRDETAQLSARLGYRNEERGAA